MASYSTTDAYHQSRIDTQVYSDMLDWNPNDIKSLILRVCSNQPFGQTCDMIRCTNQKLAWKDIVRDDYLDDMLSLSITDITDTYALIQDICEFLLGWFAKRETMYMYKKDSEYKLIFLKQDIRNLERCVTIGDFSREVSALSVVEL